jgi:thiol-disulfide isomerase/thioredoxin
LAKKAAETPAAPVVQESAPIDAAGLLRVTWGQNGAATQPFDMTAQRGKPVALFFWAPGVRVSMLELIETAAFFRREAPLIPFFAVAGKREGQRLDSMYETFKLLGLPDDVPLLIDPDFVTAGVLGIPDVPSLALFNAKGSPVVTQIKSMTHVLGGGPAGPVTAANVVKALAAGHPLETLPRPRPYYPGTELYGACAPSFRLPQFGSGKDFRFSGKSPNGRPTLVMFWSPTCKHCQKEIPQLVAHYKAHPGLYDVVGITTVKKDKPGAPSHRELTAQYIESIGIPWPILEDADASVGELFNVISTPTTYLIAPNGEVIDAWYFVHANMDEAMEKDLARLKAVSGECKARPVAKPHLDFNVTAPDGKEAAVSALADKPTLVHLWATWCQPCLKELPSFIEFKKRVGKDANVVFVSVEDAESGPTIEKFKKDHAFAFESYRAPHGGLAEQLELGYAVPRTYLLGPGAEVLDVRYGDQPWGDPDFERQVRARMQLPPVTSAH